jgi:hypothetical protein
VTDPELTLSDDELKAEFAALFPNGWAGPDVLAELAPGGWAASPLAAVFHPSAAQVHEEAVRVGRNLAALGRRPDAPPPPPEPTLAEIKAEHVETPVEPERECQELVGWCLWDIFSDNHEVTAADGRTCDLGSHRSAGGFLAEVLNAQGGPPPAPKPPELDAMLNDLLGKAGTMPPEFLAQMKKEMGGDGGYAYVDFYMGTRSVGGRADLGPVYEMIFRRLRARDMDWSYTFPRLYLADFRPLKKMLDEQKREEAGEEEWSGYDPAAAFEEEAADRKKDEEIAEMRAKLDDGHREAVAAAQRAEPPATVRAYRAVYGAFPQGWPPEA